MRLQQITSLFPECFGTAMTNGWWEAEQLVPGFIDPQAGWLTVPEKVALIHSEVSEALEELRVGRIETILNEKGKPEGALSEIADVAIRIGDLCGALWLHPLEQDARPEEVEAIFIAHVKPSARLGFIHGAISGILTKWSQERPPRCPEMVSQIATVLVYLDRLCVGLDGDLVQEMRAKMSYNLTRTYRHGGKHF